jgi:large subunit ribosomal protein L21
MPDISETVEQEEHTIMYAVIATGGKQYRVNVGDEVFIEKIEGEAGDSVTFGEVLAVSDDAGLRVGAPTLDGASVEAEIVKQGKGKKIIIFKYKAKKGYRRKNGHRQPYTRVRIVSILA